MDEEEEKLVSASRFYGIWESDEWLDADELIAELRAAR